MRVCLAALSAVLLPFVACDPGVRTPVASPTTLNRTIARSSTSAPTTTGASTRPNVTTTRPAATSTRPATTVTIFPPATWVLGAHPLPLNPDGTGKVEPTPAALVDRQLPTKDILPPPKNGQWHATIGPITAAIRTRMGQTWQPACPVSLAQLRYLTLTFRGFDHKAHTGELVVNASQATKVVTAFHVLFAVGFPIEEMRLPTTADLVAKPTGDGNDTASYVCRPARGSTVWSAHAFGLAIDINPFQNPYSKGAQVLPELASSYLNRADVRPGMILPGSVVVRVFAAIGWSWGGAWRSPVDRMHMTATGR